MVTRTGTETISIRTGAIALPPAWCPSTTPSRRTRIRRLPVLVLLRAMTMLQAVDGVALKWAVDAWASAPADREDPTFAAAESLRWTEYALQRTYCSA